MKPDIPLLSSIIKPLKEEKPLETLFTVPFENIYLGLLTKTSTYRLMRELQSVTFQR
jgi:hypothetical protein